jgi:hypothetical protein
VLAVAALAAAGTLLPFTLFAFGQSRVSAEIAGAFLNLEPLVGALAGVVIFGNPVGPEQVTGGAAIVAGIGLSSLPLLTGRREAGGHGPSWPDAARDIGPAAGELALPPGREGPLHSGPWPISSVRWMSSPRLRTLVTPSPSCWAPTA